MLNENKIFIAGATGMVGSSILTYLLNQYPSIKIRACYDSSVPFIIDDRVEYVRANLTSLKEARRAISGCNLAVMAAATHTGGASTFINEPWQQITDNVTMFAHILEASHYENVERMVWIGSVTLYQEFDGFIKESDLVLDKDPHISHFCIGWVMRFAEKLCQFWREQGKMQIINVRSANIFGPYARFDPQRSNFIPAIIRKAVDKMDPFEVWGSPDITRDVIFAEDFARAITLFLTKDDIISDTFNIGSGTITTVHDVVQWALKYSNHSPKEIQYLSDKPTTIKFRGLDVTKISEAIGWHPKYSIEEGIRITTEWWIKNKHWWTK